jgi:transcriptional regulator NrdR family protein
METGGGTQIWCPKCKSIRECKVLWYDNTSKGNFYNKEFPDLNWRQRPRECNSCGHTFDTYEIHSSAIKELIKLRKTLTSIQKTIELHQSSTSAVDELLDALREDSSE